MFTCTCGFESETERGLKIHQGKMKGKCINQKILPPPPDDWEGEIPELELYDEIPESSTIDDRTYKYPVLDTDDEKDKKKKKKKGKKTPDKTHLKRGKKKLGLLMKTGARVENYFIGFNAVQIEDDDINSIFEDLKELFPDADWDKMLDPRFSICLNLGLIYGLPAFLHWDEIKKNYKRKMRNKKIKGFFARLPLIGKFVGKDKNLENEKNENDNDKKSKASSTT